MNIFVKNFLKEEDGVSLIEYGLIGAVVAVGSITALTSLKGAITTNMGKSKTALEKTY